MNNDKDFSKFPEVIFAQPFTVNGALAARTEGKVAVLDLGFNNGAPGSKDRYADFRNTTQAFIDILGDRLVCWVDHHPHEGWAAYTDDPRFILKPREEAPACPPLITSDLVVKVDTIVTHGDFDGVMSAVKYALGGVEPYEGADADAIAADTRVGELSEYGRRLEEAMKADLRADSIREAVYIELVTGDTQPAIDEARAKYAAIKAETERLTLLYEERGNIVRFINVVAAQARGRVNYDLTQLLMAGQHDDRVAVALNFDFKGEPQLTISGRRGWNFVSMFGLPGGMPNRVSISIGRLEEVIEKVNNATVSISVHDLGLILNAANYGLPEVRNGRETDHACGRASDLLKNIF